MSLTFEQGLTGSIWHILIRIVDGLVSLCARQRRKVAIRHGCHILHTLPDSILRNIGIYRGDIHNLVSAMVDAPRDGDDRSRRFLR